MNRPNTPSETILRGPGIDLKPGCRLLRHPSEIEMIDSEKLYPLREAARLIPSTRRGSLGVCLDTVRDWIKRGILRAVWRQMPHGKQWFVRGAELERILTLQGDEKASPPRSAWQRQRDARACLKRLAKRGMKVQS